MTIKQRTARSIRQARYWWESDVAAVAVTRRTSRRGFVLSVVVAQAELPEAHGEEYLSLSCAPGAEPGAEGEYQSRHTFPPQAATNEPSVHVRGCP